MAVDPPPMRQIANVISDRGSRYAVSGGPARSRVEVDALLAALRRDKRFARATHNSWAVRLSEGGPLKGDDGEAGAGIAILKVLEGADIQDHVIVVSRWFGGRQLGGDRFRHVTAATRIYLETAPRPI